VGGGYFWVWILSFIYLSLNFFFIHLFLFFFYFFLHFFSLLIFSLKRRMRWFNLVTFWVLLLSKMYVWYYDGYNRIVVIYCDFTEVIKWNFISIVTLNITEIILCTGANHWMMQERWGACQYDDKNQWLSCELWYMLLWILIKLRSIYQMSPCPKSYSWTKEYIHYWNW
jgi:hypothetical protein